jgi:hypothetical protein
VQGRSFSGFALEVGEDATHGNFESFKRSVTKESRLLTEQLDRGIVTVVGVSGQSLTIRHNSEDDLPFIQRDGQPWEYQDHLDVYRPVDRAGPISQGWLSGTLAVEAGGKNFRCTVTRDGKVTWQGD